MDLQRLSARRALGLVVSTVVILIAPLGCSQNGGDGGNGGVSGQGGGGDGGNGGVSGQGGGGAGGDGGTGGTILDEIPPSIPTNLRTRALSMTEVGLSWSAATDNVGVAGYHVYRDDDHLQSVSETSTSDPDRSPGTLYCYQVSAFDAAGNESSKSIDSCISLGNESPVAVLKGPISEPADVEVTFDGSDSRDADGTIVSYSFDFDDGTVVTQPTPIATHIYTSASTYAVSLTVTDDWGATGSATHEATIGLVLGPVVNASNTSNPNQFESFSRIAAGPIDVIWEDDFTNIMHSRSTDGGLTFSQARYVVAPNTYPRSTQMDVTSGSGVVHVAWQVFGPSSTEVIHARSVDGGASFSAPVTISVEDEVGSYVPSIATNESDAVGIVWEDSPYAEPNDLYYRGSVDRGITFAPQVFLGTPGSCPVIAMKSDHVYAAWADLGDLIEGKVLFIRSTDGGQTFAAPVVVDEPRDRLGCPLLAVDAAGTIHLVGVEGGYLAKKLVYWRSTDEGASFSAPTDLTPAELDLQCPSLTTNDAGRVYVTASRFDGAEHDGAYLIFSGASGLSFSPPLRIRSEDPNDACYSVTAGTENEIGLGWHGADIYYRSAEVTGR